jgi:4-hydroxyphenylpyruvate dioxygenase
MASEGSIGIRRLLGLHYYVRDLERSRHFYTDLMDFQEIGSADAELVEGARQRSLVFQAGGCTVVCSAPEGPGGRAWRYLQKHPDGIGTIAFEVEDIDRCFSVLEQRGGTPIDEVTRYRDRNGQLSTFSITTPFGDTTFRFIERDGTPALFPHMQTYETPRGGTNRFEFSHIDHITSNFETMKPALLWLEHVLGFENYWDVQFHTQDVARTADGSGLKSQVMWEPQSRVKFANNEPYRPYFKQSQINAFHELHRGDGVQHAALVVRDIVSAVQGLRARGVEFMPTPDAYYDRLPQRLERSGIGAIEEDIGTLRDLGILVDGSAEGQYLLQIFLKDSAGLYGNPEAGPFFFEIIERKGDEGFGAGNFRALFESIERHQRSGTG